MRDGERWVGDSWDGDSWDGVLYLDREYPDRPTLLAGAAGPAHAAGRRAVRHAIVSGGGSDRRLSGV